MQFLKSKILANPKGNVWKLKAGVSISECGLKAISLNITGQYVFATEGFNITGKHCQKENSQYPGTIVFYYEVTFTTSGW
jgi:hypothetical protein